MWKTKDKHFFNDRLSVYMIDFELFGLHVNMNKHFFEIQIAWFGFILSWNKYKI